MKLFKKIFIIISFIFIVTGCNNKKAYITINCDKTSININEEVNCKLTGYLDDNITSVSGKLDNSSNIELSSIEGNDIWQGSKNSNIIEYYSSVQEPGEFEIATFKIKGIKKGTAKIKFTKINYQNGDVVKPNIGNSKFEPVNVNDSQINIKVN